MPVKKMFVLAALVGLCFALFACGGECPPQPACPTCPQPAAAPPPQPAAQPTGPTVDEWISLPFRILFRTSGSELDAEAQRLLAEVVETMRSRTDVIRVRVEGHTDSRGPDAANENLSIDRAQAVMRYLIGLGVPASMLEAEGYGSTRPITSDSQEMDRAQNRRVEFSALIRRPVGAR